MKKVAFSAWKARAMHRLIQIARRADNEKLVEQINHLLVRLRNAKRRDIAIVLHDIYLMYRYWQVPELLSVIPSEEELDSILKSGEDEE